MQPTRYVSQVCTKHSHIHSKCKHSKGKNDRNILKAKPKRRRYSLCIAATATYDTMHTSTRIRSNYTFLFEIIHFLRHKCMYRTDENRQKLRAQKHNGGVESRFYQKTNKRNQNRIQKSARVERKWTGKNFRVLFNFQSKLIDKRFIMQMMSVLSMRFSL